MAPRGVGVVGSKGSEVEGACGPYFLQLLRCFWTCGFDCQPPRAPYVMPLSTLLPFWIKKGRHFSLTCRRCSSFPICPNNKFVSYLLDWLKFQRESLWLFCCKRWKLTVDSCSKDHDDVTPLKISGTPICDTGTLSSVFSRMPLSLSLTLIHTHTHTHTCFRWRVLPI